MSERRIVIERLYEAFNTRRFEVFGELLDADLLLVMNGQSLRGAAAWRDYAATVVREVSGARAELAEVIAESGDAIVTRTRLSDASSSVAAESSVSGGRPLPLTSLEVYRIVRGRVVEWRIHLDAGDQPSGRDAAPWPGITQLVGEQSALRRVATLVARGATQPEVFDAVVSGAGELLGGNVMLLRFDADDAIKVLAQHSSKDFPDLTGLAMKQGGAPPPQVKAGRPTRIDRDKGLFGPGAELARHLGIVANATTPVFLQGELWGALAVFSRVGLAVEIEDRLTQFADLVATAIANAQSRAELELLADEQSALRGVAELVARGAAIQEVFDRVTAEASRLLGDLPNALERYERSGTEVTIVAEARLATLEPTDERYVRGTRLPVVGDTARARVWRTGRTTRVDDYEGVAGVETVRRGARASVAAPVIVDGKLWGVLTTGGPVAPLPAGTEERLTRFCELVAAAIANADSRVQLTASRARIVASGDEARRRLARDVHDGAQQRLVHAIIMLKQAREALGATASPAAELVEDSLRQAQAANEQLRDLVHGIMPAAIARGGLAAAVESLRSHVPLTVDSQILANRLPEQTELTAYFVISEALTNAVKHARAGHAQVRAVLDDGRLRVDVSDDGRGGADPAAGSGLVGLADRVDAAGGTLSLTSPPGEGTTLSITLPIDWTEPAGPDARTH